MDTQVKDVRLKLTKNRIKGQEIRSSTDEPLGPETTAVSPEDVELMYVGKLGVMLLKQKVAATNQLKGYVRAYGEVHPGMEATLEKHLDIFSEQFDRIKSHLNKIALDHPLAQSITRVKGINGYQLGIIMAMIKDISRFATPSRLMVYAGVCSKFGLKVCKKNIHRIREISSEQYTGDLEEYTEFGYNTMLQQRMYILTDCLLRTNPFFQDFYQNTRKRLIQRAINGGECWLPSDEERKGTKMKKDTYYMKGRKTQSLEAWSNSNARWRVARTMLHFIYKEWREYAGLSVRNPYPIDYQGHQKYISLDDVLRGQERE